MYFNPKDKDGNKLQRNEEGWYANTEWSAVGELGSKFFVSNSISLNIALNYNYLPSDNLDDVTNDISNGTQNDIFFTGRAGISFYFGGISDTDNDGVRDEEDMCPDTPPGVTVDLFGCPIDSDKDGVPDKYRDSTLSLLKLYKFILPELVSTAIKARFDLLSIWQILANAVNVFSLVPFR